MTLTPWEQRGAVMMKRDDLYEYGGAYGGKARTLKRLCEQARLRGAPGICSPGARESTQLERCALIGRAAGLAVRLHVPTGKRTHEMIRAERAGAELVRHKPGYLSVLRARALEDSRTTGYAHIPFGLECRESIEEVAEQVQGLPPGLRRLVVPVGSGMTLAGILRGLDAHYPDLPLPILGVRFGGDPEARLDLWAPPAWRFRVELLEPDSPYNRPAGSCLYEGVRCDPYAEAKCIPHLRHGDGFWLVAIRASEQMHEEVPAGDEFGEWLQTLPRTP